MRVLNPVAPHLFHRLTVETSAGRIRERTPGRATYTHQLEAFRAWVRDGVPMPTDGADGVRNMQVIDAVYRAAPVEGRHALVGSIFPSGLLFSAGSYRTSPPSEMLLLLSGKNIGVSGKEKTGHPGLLSPNVPSGGPDERLFELQGFQKLADHLARIYAIKPLLEAA